MEKEVEEYVGWKNVQEDFHTKTTLNRELGLKPFDEKDFDALVRALNYSGSWETYKLYHKDNTIEIKRRKIKEIESSPANLAEALYIINKSTKVSRDTKNENYSRNRHDVVKRAKIRQEKLYEIKEKAIEKMLDDGLAKVLGYHIQKSNRPGKEMYLMLFKVGDFTFHSPSTFKKIEKLTLLG